MSDISEVPEWTTSDVERWLEGCGLGKFVSLICQEHEIDGKSLLALTENDLRSPPLQLKKLGDIKKIGMRIRELQEKYQMTKPKTESLQSSSGQEGMNLLTPPSTTRRRKPRVNGNGNVAMARSQRLIYSASSDGDESSLDDYYQRHPSGKQIVFNPEYKKAFVSFLYSLVAMFTTAYTMTVVHDRVPDKTKHPPLPDIFLDNVPLIPYAFVLAEVCGLALIGMWTLILIFHKHRIILIRRMYSIASSVFLLRCITMFVTSLSVPGAHLQCQSDLFRTTYQRITRALEIFTGFGMSMSGIHTCGDYMFSGHTVALTLLNHLITEYTPSRWFRVHTASWIFNLFGVFFILAGHEHYSIDVVIAFYITSRIFLYYHMLANTRSYKHSRRIRIWFPLFSYFECNVPGKVPNEYEWPITFNSIRNFGEKAFKLRTMTSLRTS